ncbi:nucleotidyl transferase AbiEii/AbiGii toxin family protein [Sphingomonas sp.]|uniref:nucleotidyl transferase AbiEii/AbiGii toxin family protein n=1 Tax=Sphingomonas sp. TaxID=28214 RepID=UPI00289E510C|nr:nucleotidyl transferase AbiEii/AbiGii toxin family protein [Sphingomonas sp.]
MHLNALPESTKRVLSRAHGIVELRDHLLIGGTAMTLQVGHRVSEDLDFVQFGSKLDRELIAGILSRLRGSDKPELVTSLVARQTFDNEGEDIDDVHQDWMVDGTKVTFFCPDRPEELDVLTGAKPLMYGDVPVADLDTIFKLKAMVVAERWTSRDAFDLLHFVQHQGRDVSEIDEMIRRKLPLYPLTARMALLTRPFRLVDPGFQPASSEGPQTLKELADDMKLMIKRHESTIGGRTASLLKGPNTSPVGSPPRSRDR